MQAVSELVEETSDIPVEPQIEIVIASTLFTLAGWSYEEEKHSILKEFFLNPLCKTMFQIRGRSFSDYEEKAEPLKQEMARTLIANILSSRSQSDKIEYFFEQMNQLKSFPLSQKQTVDYRYGSMATFMEEVIAPSLRTYLASNPGLGVEQVYDDLKYQIASDIEEKDYFCCHNYNALMGQIQAYIRNNMPERSFARAPGLFAKSSQKGTGVDEAPLRRTHTC